MKLGQMKLAFSIRASLIGLGAIASSASLAQSGWFWQNPLPQGNTLRAVSFVDANTGTAVGDAGAGVVVGDGATIRRATDGGATWTPQTSGTTGGLDAVSFVDANTGAAVGDTILRTTDGGATWTPQMSGTGNCCYGVSVVDANTGTGGGQRVTIIHPTASGAPLDLKHR